VNEEAGTIGEQVASKLLVEVNILAVLFAHKSVMSGFLSTWLGQLSNRMGLLLNGVGLFSGERVLENMPTHLFE